MNASWTRYLPVIIQEWLDGRHSLQQVIGNTGWLFAEKILRMGVGFLVSIWVTRYLGPEQFGLLSYSISFVMIFSFLATLGLDGIVVRNIVREPTRKEEILGTCFVLKLFGGIIACILTMTAIIILKPTDHLSWLLVAIVSLGTVLQAFTTIDFWFQSQVKSKYSSISRSTAHLISCAAKVAFILTGAPLVAFAWTGVIDIALCSAGLVIAYRANSHYLKNWRATRLMAMELLQDSWPLIFSDVLIIIYMRIDKIMLGDMAGNTELGIYAVAALIAEALYLIPTVITSSVFPSIVEAKRHNEALFYERLQKLYNLMVFLGYAIALPMTFLAEWLVPFMFGQSYAKAGVMLVVLVWAGVFINLMIARSYFLTAMNWTRLHMLVDFLGCVLTISLNIFLIPLYGGMGAAIASLIAYWFVVHGLCFVFKPLHKTGTMINKALLYPKIW